MLLFFRFYVLYAESYMKTTRFAPYAPQAGFCVIMENIPVGGVVSFDLGWVSRFYPDVLADFSGPYYDA